MRWFDSIRGHCDLPGETETVNGWNAGRVQTFSPEEGGSRMLGALLVVAFVIAIGLLTVLYGVDSRLPGDRGSFF
ncbi:MAG TPA: hypothetical protein VKB13_01895 [Gaiellaceae bacterium]|nr:hypothetical protein [Gaiellaceae bacterium]